VNKLINKTPNIFYHTGLVFLVIVITYFTFDSFIDNSKTSIIGTLFDSRSRFDFLSNLKGSTFSSVNLMSYQVNSGRNYGNNYDIEKTSSISYIYSKLNKDQGNSIEQNNIQQIILSDLTKVGTMSHQNINSVLPGSDLLNLSLPDLKNGYLNSKQENISKKPEPNAGLNTGLIANNILIENIDVNDTYEKIGIAPGGDPTDPVPIGDGYFFLLLLMTGYTILKLKIKRISLSSDFYS